jgi:hypothetical protein
LTVSVTSVCWPPTAVATTATSLGTMSRSSSVVNTTGSDSVRGVATSVPAGTVSVASCAAASQKVTGARAAVGGRRRIPSRSRNLT